MRMHYLIRRFAGVFILASLALGYWVSPTWYLFTAFVGANLLQSSFTRWCLLEGILQRIGAGQEPVQRVEAAGTIPRAGRSTRATSRNASAPRTSRENSGISTIGRWP